MYNLTFLGNKSLDLAIAGTSNGLPGFQQFGGLMELILLFLWAIIFFGGIYATKRQIGGANVAVFGTIASITITLSSFILYLIPDMLPLSAVILNLCITIMFVVWLLLVQAED
jgi:hypothetical protein